MSFSALPPVIPDNGLIYTLGRAGGAGGTIILAVYGYWLREKGWAGGRWMRVVRLDNSIAYVVSGIVVVAMLVVGAELLYSANIALSTGDRALLRLADILEGNGGAFMSYFFRIGFFETSLSSILGVWNGVSLMFADFGAKSARFTKTTRAAGSAESTTGPTSLADHSTDYAALPR